MTKLIEIDKLETIVTTQLFINAYNLSLFNTHNFTCQSSFLV